MLDLRAEGALGAALLTDLPQLSEPLRTVAVHTWLGRMVNEHISAQVFGALLGQAMAAGLPAKRIADLAAFAGEELAHARQCAAAVAALGGQAQAPYPPLARVPDHLDAASPLEAVLRNIIAVCCLSETVAVALIRAETLEIGPATLKKLLDGILADEVGHARWGWTLLDELAPLDPALCRRLDAYLTVALVHLVEHELAFLPDHGGMGDQAAQLGVCSGQAARTLFLDTVETVIVPGLQRHGLQAQEAWQQAQARLRAKNHVCMSPLPLMAMLPRASMA